jgi:hypothetical protein
MKHKISCAVYDPTPGRCDCGAKSDLQIARERIAELEEAYFRLVGHRNEIEEENERLKRGRDRLIETQEELIEENKRLTSACCANPTILDAERWDAFRKSKVTDIIFEDMAHHSFHGPPMPDAIDDLGDFLIKRSKQ